MIQSMKTNDDSRLWPKIHTPAATSVPKQEHMDWLSDAAGTGNWFWSHGDDWSTFIFYIRDEELALLFKLQFPL